MAKKMEIRKCYKIPFDTSETVLAITISDTNEWIMLISSGKVIRYKIKEQKSEYLFSVKSDIGYTDGGFDIHAESTVYTLDSIVVIVNNYKRHGFIHYPGKYHSLHLWREDYHADISCYPIALFKDKYGVPHIIYGVAWNHVQIMNLDTRQVLTAAKSLIEENAEEKHIEFYKNFKEENKFPWPQPYDYFFGKLHLSPNRRKFLSAGWAWGSSDYYKVYDLEHFIRSNRIADIDIGAWEHNNRAICWIDDETIAVAYHPFSEGDDNATAESPSEIHLYKIFSDKAEIINKIQVKDINVVDANIFYNQKYDSIIIFSNKKGLVILSLDGQILLYEKNIMLDDYSIEKGLLWKKENDTLYVYEISK